LISKVLPFFSKKGNCGEQKIVLFENDKIVNNPNEVSNHFNIFFSTVANKIGIDAVYDQFLLLRFLVYWIYGPS
jgi:hypothetical protein